MNRKLFLRMVFWLLLVTIGTFTLSHKLASTMRSELTRISVPNQQILADFAAEAEGYYQTKQLDKIAELTRRIDQQYGAWAAVRATGGELHTHRVMPESLVDTFDFRRKITYPVHSFFKNLVIGVPFSDGGGFVIELPQKMYPTTDPELLHNLLTLVLPSMVVILFCWFLYRHIMQPLEVLNQSTLALAKGKLDTRARAQLPSGRHDEITQLADSFDAMAERLQQLVTTQRQLLGDLSHELRTPLTRIDLVVNQCENRCARSTEQLPRLNNEIRLMNELVEDALTLAWLDDKPPIKCDDQFDLAELITVIADDAAFEYPNHQITRKYEPCPLQFSNQRMLAQSIENVLRNALKYSPEGSSVTVCSKLLDNACLLHICDSGPGVADEHHQDIFKPFYRVDKARSRDKGGFGLGLAIVKRQITALGGKVSAANSPKGGLKISMRIPFDSRPFTQTGEQ